MSRRAFRDGKIPFKIEERNEPCETYYKIYGDLHSGTLPLVVLHGGPGSGHEYIEPYCHLCARYGIPVVFYDQIGCASSTHLREKKGDKAFWQPSLFVRELENVLDHLEIGKDGGPGFDILGHSWGSILAVNFIATRQPATLRRLIIANGSADSQLFKSNLWELTKTFPQEHQTAIEDAIKTDNFTTPAYLDALGYMRHTYLCRANPWPPEMVQNAKNQAEDTTVRESMQGRSPWLYNGSLEHYSSVPLLPKIHVPTLVFNGEFDTTHDSCIKLFVDHIPKVRRVKLLGTSHMPQLDSKESLDTVLTLVGDFLQQPEDVTL